MGHSGVRFVYYFAAAYTGGLSTLAWKLKTKDVSNGDLANDFAPTTLATQGSFVPVLLGRRRIGYVFLAAWGMRTFGVTQKVETKGSKKKNKPTGQIVYAEAGWHGLCIGPAARLRKIYADGKVIFDTEIDSDSTPSGSTLNCSDGSGDSFRIFWGEGDQPVNATLGGSETGKPGISSAWPYLCYVEWIRKTLGGAPHWPQIEYDLEVALGDADPCSDGVIVTGTEGTPLAGPDLGTGTAPGAGNTGVNDYDFQDDFVVATEGWYYLEPDPLGAQTNVVYLRHYDLAAGSGTPPSAHTWDYFYVDLRKGPVGGPFTDAIELLDYDDPTYPDVVFSDATRGADIGGCWTKEQFVGVYWRHFHPLRSRYVYLTPGTWTLRLLARVTEDGSAANNQHFLGFELNLVPLTDAVVATAGFGGMIRRLLFEPFPHGVGLDSDLFDLDSLDAAGMALEDEGLRFSLLARDGEEAVAVLGGLMQDAGAMLYRHPVTGLLTFALQRIQGATAIPADMVIDGVANAEIVTRHRDVSASRLEFLFPDVARAFRETGITIDADGVADRLSTHRTKKVQLLSVVDADSAAVIAERRSQEELAGTAGYTLKLGREARGEIRPGSVLSFADIGDVLRVLEVKPESDGNALEVRAAPDAYGSTPSTFAVPPSGTGAGGLLPVEADEMATAIEIPEVLLGAGDPVTIGVLRVRAHEQVYAANIHLSADGATYQDADTDYGIQTGGVLLQAIDIDDPWLIETGPTLTILGPPDVDVLDDLTADPAAWRLGRQVASINGELFFVRQLVAVGGSTYRLDGLIRARYDTNREAHGIGDEVYLFRFDEVAPITDPAIYPGADLYVKAQPVAAAALSLASTFVAAHFTVYGKGTVPPAPVGLRVVAPILGSTSYRTGEDIQFRWASRLANPFCGAGAQGAGDATGTGGPATLFELRVWAGPTFNDLMRTQLSSLPEWTYLNADLQADLGGEVDFYIEVFEIRNGLYSDIAWIDLVEAL